MRRRTYDVVGRDKGRQLLETQGTHSDLAAAFLWIARTICISQETLRHFFFDPAQPVQNSEKMTATRPHYGGGGL